MRSISLLQENQIHPRQQQQLLINLAMKQAFHVLQLPLLELSEWVKNEIESNPILEIDLSQESFKHSLNDLSEDTYFPYNRSQEEWEKRRKQHQENLLTTSISLYEHLMQQIPLVLEKKQDRHIAEIIIGHLNDKGYLDNPLQEIAPSIPLESLQRVLNIIQSLDPPGIAALNLQDCLLLQLKMKQKDKSTAAKILSEHFQSLIHNRLPHIAQSLGIPLQEVIQIIKTDIAPLDLYPGYRYFSQPCLGIVPDLIFLSIEETWHIEVNTSRLPRFHIAPVYLETLAEKKLEANEFSYLRRKIAGGKWLQRIVHRRNSTLRNIGEFLLKKQGAFFNGERSNLLPLTLTETAQALGLHESTIARAVANKYLACPLGLFSLRSFFHQGMTTQNGRKISNHSLREILACTIENEDKLKPLSDAQLAQQFKKMGIPCARRTITKYRTALNISSAAKRRKWH